MGKNIALFRQCNIFGVDNKREYRVRPETEQQKSPITIQLERRLNLILNIYQYISALLLNQHSSDLLLEDLKGFVD